MVIYIVEEKFSFLRYTNKRRSRGERGDYFSWSGLVCQMNRVFICQNK